MTGPKPSTTTTTTSTTTTTTIPAAATATTTTTTSTTTTTATTTSTTTTTTSMTYEPEGWCRKQQNPVKRYGPPQKTITLQKHTRQLKYILTAPHIFVVMAGTVEEKNGVFLGCFLAIWKNKNISNLKKSTGYLVSRKKYPNEGKQTLIL